ncbi:poly-beta-1,6-N-acetyl-D-glucosamine biosynthesis protein PgaD [Methylomonas sp. SURF-1]|uniref:Poly-beta-1,6-N-acetyl-D-glucosamine biosynthesis protein PgaD n=1 Tax=Methylomonas aurea TaxID=2952224 RepID=A0ABT1UHH9_9GAMM|nr:poly-beta-1,6-N-acetyl-D-glucosamine biosynthesis protein PgaD [Methylomonas sp. SURF-1]MCQ8181693.1 poly-beta-1,6-N-acetyl-D-glucosamine biosynthesis protein PgaD [Methylomonas sp. SURF-1]
MKEIIINQPHLQSFQQKCASVLMALMSWVLWLYFLWPLFTLTAWLMGLKSLSDEIRWFGGYKTLLELLELYGEIVLAIALFWLCWTLFLSWRHSVVAPKRSAPVTDQQLAVAFKVDLAELRQARQGKKLTVHFDEHAGITAIGND